MDTQTNMNIPTMSAGSAVKTLTLLCNGIINKKAPLRRSPVPFLWGPPGVGKTDAVWETAKQLGKITGKKVNVKERHLILFTPFDILGMPYEKDGCTHFTKPELFDFDDSDDIINILFLDELSAATPTVQAAAYQICFNKRVGEHELPDNCLVIAAGNRLTDQSVSFKMPKALCNRLIHFNIVSEFESWKTWAFSHNISSNIIAYLTMDNSRINITPGTEELAFCTPRSWEAVSEMLAIADNDPDAAYNLIAGNIGCDTATEFVRFCRGALNMPNVDEILAGRCRDLPKKHDVMFALVSALVARIANNPSAISYDEFENICMYIKALPRDFVMLFLEDIKLIDGMEVLFRRSRTLQELINKRL